MIVPSCHVLWLANCLWKCPHACASSSSSRFAKINANLFSLSRTYVFSPKISNNNRNVHKKQPDSLDNLPNPSIDYQTHNIGNNYDQPSFICDPHSYLTNKERESIDSLIYKTMLEFNHEIGITLIKSLKHYNIGSKLKQQSSNNKIKYNYNNPSSSKRHSSINYNPKDPYTVQNLCSKYCRITHNNWIINQRGLNNGLLIFASIHDRYLCISSGTHIKHIITDDFIRDCLIPHSIDFHFQSYEYSQGLINCINNLYNVFEHYHNGTLLTDCQIYKEYSKIRAKKKKNEFWEFDRLWKYFIIALFCGVISYYTFYNFVMAYFVLYYQYNQCLNKLDKIENDYIRNKFHNSCPICLQSFEMLEKFGKDTKKQLKKTQEKQRQKDKIIKRRKQQTETQSMSNTSNVNTALLFEKVQLNCSGHHTFCKDCLIELNALNDDLSSRSSSSSSSYSRPNTSLKVSSNVNRKDLISSDAPRITSHHCPICDVYDCVEVKPLELNFDANINDKELKREMRRILRARRLHGTLELEFRLERLANDYDEYDFITNEMITKWMTNILQARLMDEGGRARYTNFIDFQLSGTNEFLQKNPRFVYKKGIGNFKNKNSNNINVNGALGPGINSTQGNQIDFNNLGIGSVTSQRHHGGSCVRPRHHDG